MCRLPSGSTCSTCLEVKPVSLILSVIIVQPTCNISSLIRSKIRLYNAKYIKYTEKLIYNIENYQNATKFTRIMQWLIKIIFLSKTIKQPEVRYTPEVAIKDNEIRNNTIFVTYGSKIYRTIKCHNVVCCGTIVLFNSVCIHNSLINCVDVLTVIVKFYSSNKSALQPVG